MHHIEGCHRNQAQLLPARVDDYVDRGSPVRFIAAFVADLDLHAAGFATADPIDTGRPRRLQTIADFRKDLTKKIGTLKGRCGDQQRGRGSAIDFELTSLSSNRFACFGKG